MATSVLLLVLAGLLVIAGLAGLVLPLLPGAPVLFAGLMLAAWAEDFTHVGAPALTVIGILALLTYAADLLGGAVGARRFGATGKAMAGALVGAVVGIFFGLPGVILGPFIGALLGEYREVRNLRQAGMAGVGASLGLLIAIAAKLALAVGMIGVFVLARWVV